MKAEPTLKVLPSSVLVRVHSSRPEEAQALAKKLRLRPKKEFKADTISPEASELTDEARKLERVKKHLGLAPRENRGDTGEQVFGSNGVPNSEVGQLIRDLLAQGYRFTNVHYQDQPLWSKRKGKDTGRHAREFDLKTGKDVTIMKTVTTFTFSLDQDEESQDKQFLAEVLTHFDGAAYRRCDIWWKNGNRPDTVNLSGGIDPNVGKYKRFRFNAKGEYSIEDVVKPRPDRANA